MSKFEEYLDRAKNLAEEAGEAAKKAAEDVVDRAKDLSDERSKVKELMKNAKEQTTAATLNVKEKVQGMIQDAGAVKELKQGIAELEALPEIEGSIVYSMDVGALINDLRSLSFYIEDKRLDDSSVEEEIKKVMVKIQPSGDPQIDKSEEDLAIDKAKAIAFDACIRALDALQQNK